MGIDHDHRVICIGGEHMLDGGDPGLMFLACVVREVLLRWHVADQHWPLIPKAVGRDKSAGEREPPEISRPHDVSDEVRFVPR